MKVDFKTISDTQSFILIKGSDLNESERNSEGWSIDFDISIPGPSKTKFNKSNLNINCKIHTLRGKMPADVTGRVRNLPAKDDFVGVEIWGSVDINLDDDDLIPRLQASQVSIKMNKKKVKLNLDTKFNWAMEGRLQFTKSV